MSFLLGSFMEGFQAQQDFQQNQEIKKQQVFRDKLQNQMLQQQIGLQQTRQAAAEEAQKNTPVLGDDDDSPISMLKNDMLLSAKTAKILQSKGDLQGAKDYQREFEESAAKYRQYEADAIKEIGTALYKVDTSKPEEWHAALDVLQTNDLTKDYLKRSAIDMKKKGIDILNGNDPIVRAWANKMSGDLKSKELDTKSQQAAALETQRETGKQKLAELELAGKIQMKGMEIQGREIAAALRGNKTEDKAQRLQEKKVEESEKLIQHYDKEMDDLHKNADTAKHNLAAQLLKEDPSLTTEQIENSPQMFKLVNEHVNKIKERQRQWGDIVESARAVVKENYGIPPETKGEGTKSSPAVTKSQADYDKLKVGQYYVKDGVVYQKK